MEPKRNNLVASFDYVPVYKFVLYVKTQLAKKHPSTSFATAKRIQEKTSDF